MFFHIKCAWVEFLFILCVSGIPDENARARILSVLSRKLRLEGSFDFKRIARRTPGFVGADLAALSKEAAALAVKRIFSSKETRSIFSSLNVLLDCTFLHHFFMVVPSRFLHDFIIGNVHYCLFSMASSSFIVLEYGKT